MHLYWMDLETTGLDPEECQILEVAVSRAVLEAPFAATPIYGANAYWPMSDRIGNGVEPRAMVMHHKSGLLDACDLGGLSVGRMEKDLLERVPFVADPEERPVLAGAGVHFDLSFLKVHMPLLATRFSHRLYDTSAVKLFCRSLGMPKIPRGEAHRAAADVLEAIAHAKACRDWLSARADRAQQDLRELRTAIAVPQPLERDWCLNFIDGALARGAAL